MITHFEMTTGEVLNATNESGGLAREPAPAVQIRLLTIDEALDTERETASAMPVNLFAEPIEQLLARYF